jgi:hypothetical protein
LVGRTKILWADAVLSLYSQYKGDVSSLSSSSSDLYLENRKLIVGSVFPPC